MTGISAQMCLGFSWVFPHLCEGGWTMFDCNKNGGLTTFNQQEWWFHQQQWDSETTGMVALWGEWLASTPPRRLQHLQRSHSTAAWHKRVCWSRIQSYADSRWLNNLMQKKTQNFDDFHGWEGRKSKCHWRPSGGHILARKFAEGLEWNRFWRKAAALLLIQWSVKSYLNNVYCISMTLVQKRSSFQFLLLRVFDDEQLRRSCSTPVVFY